MKRGREVLQAGRFVATGVINTAVGLGTIALVRNIGGTSEYVANLLGFVTGLACSFTLNRLWTFRSRQQVNAVLPRYLAAFVVSYLFNLAILSICLRLKLPPNAAQAAAMISYSAIFFLLCRRFVFRDQSC